MTPDEERHIEAWKLVIEFDKTTIGLSASVLTIILGLVVVGEIEFNSNVIITGAVLLLSVVLALFGFGQGIKILKSGPPQVGAAQPGTAKAILCSNLAPVALILSVGWLAFTATNEELSVDQVLAHVHSSARTMPLPLKPENCQSIKREHDRYELTYAALGTTARVIYSIKEKSIKEIK